MGAAISHNVLHGRRPSQMQQCARLLNRCGRGPPDPRLCLLASVHMTADLQQQSTFCTETASDVSNRKDSWQQPSKEQPKEVGPTISMLAKELQAQWHQERNKHLSNSVIRPHSHQKVWWSCAQCPDSLPHIWEARVHHRSRGTGCPFCSGTSVCQHNTLARKAPQIAPFWNAKKNHPLSPDQVTVFSCMRAHWKCSVCKYEWQASVVDKTSGKTGCPKCAKRNGGRKADSSRQKHPTFAQAKHALLEQWDHDKNRENGKSPDSTTLQSGKLICCVAMHVQRARSTAGKLDQAIELLTKRQLGAHFVPGVRFVNAALWKLFVLNSLLTLTLNRMVSVPLTSQVHQAPSTIGCQISLDPRSGLWLSAHSTEIRKSNHSYMQMTYSTQ
ncbi:TPA: hypothetical protein ACH3X3_000658 [Trebouxia sp. C0006]